MVKTYKISVIPGDGIGPEVAEAAITVLNAVLDAVSGLNFEFIEVEAGLKFIDKYGTNLPAHSLEIIKETNACLKGPVTTPEEPGSPRSVAVTLRTYFDLYANVRPCKTLPKVPSLHPDIDMVVVRENTEGLYVGKEFEVVPGIGVALRIITSKGCERIARFAFNFAMKRRKRLTYVHKANILKLTDTIFKNAIFKVAEEFPEVELDERRVDAMAMQLIKRPEFFDVIVTTNLFGDVLSDEAAQTVGGLGVAPGANIGDNFGMFEPIHGSAPKYTGMNKVNPTATILAAKMMLQYLGEEEAAKKVENAVIEVLKEGKVLTYDLGGTAKTSETAKAIAEKVIQQ